MRVRHKATGLEGTVEETYTNAARVRWDNNTYWTAEWDELEIL